jgi:hypothetical protein
MLIALRVEFLRSRARAMHWSEEVVLLLEEMRRVLVFMKWQARWWDAQGVRWVGLDAEQQEGLVGYARHQASIRRRMLKRCKYVWRFAHQAVRLGAGQDMDPEDPAESITVGVGELEPGGREDDDADDDDVEEWGLNVLSDGDK